MERKEGVRDASLPALYPLATLSGLYFWVPSLSACLGFSLLILEGKI